MQGTATYDFVVLVTQLLAHELAAPVLARGPVLGLDSGDYERHFGGCELGEASSCDGLQLVGMWCTRAGLCLLGGELKWLLLLRWKGWSRLLCKLCRRCGKGAG